MTYEEMLYHLQKAGVIQRAYLLDRGKKPSERGFLYLARKVDKAAPASKTRPSRIDPSQTSGKAGSSQEKAAYPVKTLLDLLKAFKTLYAEAQENNKKDKQFRKLNPSKVYRAASRDLLLLREMAKRMGYSLVGGAIPSFIQYGLQRNKPLTIHNFEIWAKKRLQKRRK